MVPGRPEVQSPVPQKINKEQINNKYVGKPLGTFYKANESAGCLALPGYTSRF